MFGPDSTVKDVYNHVRAMRMNISSQFNDELASYVAKVKSDEKVPASKNGKQNGKGNNHKNAISEANFIYVLPSMRIESIFPSSKDNLSILELYLDGFVSVDNTLNALRELRNLASTVRELDAAIHRTIYSHEYGKVSGSHSLELFNAKVRVAIASVQDCLDSAITGIHFF